MNLTAGSRPQHLEDGDLVAYMDHQMDRARSRWAAIIAIRLTGAIR